MRNPKIAAALANMIAGSPCELSVDSVCATYPNDMRDNEAILQTARSRALESMAMEILNRAEHQERPADHPRERRFRFSMYAFNRERLMELLEQAYDLGVVEAFVRSGEEE